MAEREVETQVVRIKLAGDETLQRAKLRAEGMAAAVDAARQRLLGLQAAQKKIGPPTQIEAAKEAAQDLARAARTAAGAERDLQTAAKQAAELARARMENAVDATKKWERELDAARSKADQLARSADAAAKSTAQAIRGRALDLGAGAGRAIGGAAQAAVGGTLALGGAALAQIIERGAGFQASRESLAARVGARDANAQIAEFRGIRGLGVESAIGTANRLGGLGLQAGTADVKALAQIAAGTPGKTSSDVAEALADAATGEYERLKEFNVKAKVEGDKVAVTFKGVTETIEKGGAAWQAYLNKIAASDFGDTLELRANTLAGAVESLQDKITQAASAIYESGLGEAIREVLADVGQLFDIAPSGARAIGSVLGDAVRSLWQRLKELIGPADELPGKIGKLIKAAADFAEVALKVIGVLAKVVDALGTTNTAFIALGAAGLAAFGPWGAAAAAAVTAIALIADALRDTTEEARKLEEQTKRLAQTDATRKKLQEDLEGDYEDYKSQERVTQLRSDLEKRKRENRRAGTIASPEAMRRDAEKRAADAVEIEREEALIVAEEERLAKRGRDRQKAAEDAEKKRIADEEKAAEDESQKVSDEVEFEYLDRHRAKLTPSQQKRYTELAKKLDKRKTTGKAKKPEVSALGQEIAAEIKQKSADAGRVAGLRALREGTGAAEAEAIALRTEKEVAARLRGQVNEGKLLPGQVNAGLLALARVDEVAGRGTPPPIAVTNLGPITVNPTIEVSGNTIDGSNMREIVAQARRELEARQVEQTREAFRRITSGVKG